VNLVVGPLSLFMEFGDKRIKLKMTCT